MNETKNQPWSNIVATKARLYYNTVKEMAWNIFDYQAHMQYRSKPSVS